MNNEEVRQQGRQAFIDGKSIDDNPYLYFSSKRGGLALSGHWQAGYKEAEKEQIEGDDREHTRI